MYYISRLRLTNWRNFASADVSLSVRTFLVGPNASGKSNFLDVIRFLRDLSKDGGGLQNAVNERGGVSKIRSLAARKNNKIAIYCEISNFEKEIVWRYEVEFSQEASGHRRVLLTTEKVWKGNQKKTLVARPNEFDDEDSDRLTQTNLEQVSANKQFREIADLFKSIEYLHIVPQLLRNPGTFSNKILPGDPYGQNFLIKLAKSNENTRKSRLKRIESALKLAVPQLENLEFAKDDIGHPHLSSTYKHWRVYGAKQTEDQFSDGTLRLIGLLWSLMEGSSLLLLEEPELSLHRGIIVHLAPMMYRLHQSKKKQVIVTTHSEELLMDKGISPSEVLILQPQAEKTEIKCATEFSQIVDLVDGGMSVGEAVIPFTSPPTISGLSKIQ